MPRFSSNLLPHFSPDFRDKEVVQMRKFLLQGLPETLYFLVALYLLVYLQAEEVSDILPSTFLFTAFIYFLLGFAPGCPGLLRKISREGLGLNIRPLLLPGLVVLYVALLPYLASTYAADLPDLGLGTGLVFASRAAAVWLGFLLCRSVGREPDRAVSYLRPPYQY